MSIHNPIPVPTYLPPDVYPLPLFTEVNWAEHEWEVVVFVMLDQDEEGYSSVDVWKYTEPYGDGDQSPERADTIRRKAMVEFAEDLKRALSR